MKFDPKASFCKVTGCSKKHTTYLHSQNGNLDDADERLSENKKDDQDSQNGYVKTKYRCYGVTGAGASEIRMPIVPVKVKSRSSNRTVVTYALLNSGSNTTFCSHYLMAQLGIEGEQTILSLTTLQAQERLIKVMWSTWTFTTLMGRISLNSNNNSKPAGELS